MCKLTALFGLVLTFEKLSICLLFIRFDVRFDIRFCAQGIMGKKAAIFFYRQLPSIIELTVFS
jgi:hypothetical protein